jgi:hypothetical protein
VAPADGEEFSGVSGIVETPDGGLWLGEYRGAVHIPSAEVKISCVIPPLESTMRFSNRSTVFLARFKKLPRTQA